MLQKISPNGGDSIVKMTAEINTNTGEIIFKCQDEIKSLALEIIGTDKNIFFEEIPIGNNVLLEFDDNWFRGWVLKTLNSDCI